MKTTATVNAPRLPGPEYWEAYFAIQMHKERESFSSTPARQAFQMERACEDILVSYRQAQGLRCCHAHATGYEGADHGFIGGVSDLICQESSTIGWLLTDILAGLQGEKTLREGIRAFQEEEECWAQEEMDQYRCATNHRGQP